MTDLVPFSGRTLSEAASELGEGPTFDPGTGTAWWFNITGRELHELHLESGRKAIHPLPFLGSVLAVIDPCGVDRLGSGPFRARHRELEARPLRDA